MEATLRNYVFDLREADDSQIALQLEKIITDSDRVETDLIESLTKQLDIARSSERMHNTKLAKRSEIYEKSEERKRQKDLEYQKAHRATLVARSKLRARTTLSAQARQRAATCSGRIAQIRTRMERASGIYQDDAFERRALMVRFVAPLVNTNVPIKFTNNRNGCSQLTWTTSDIFIKDGFGDFLPFNFGKFDVLVKYKSHPRHGNSVDCYCYQVGTPRERDTRIRRGYPHPHLNSEGLACLGNLAPGLISGMGDKDIARVIEEVTEFLMHYNRENPYVKLSEWGLNRWDNAMCESGEHIMADCPCSRCEYCDAIFAEEDISNCGHCHSCCIVHHVNIPTESNINGTGCITRTEYSRRQVTIAANG